MKSRTLFGWITIIGAAGMVLSDNGGPPFVVLTVGLIGWFFSLLLE